jgi:hypothetical protein
MVGVSRGGPIKLSGGSITTGVVSLVVVQAATVRIPSSNGTSPPDNSGKNESESRARQQDSIECLEEYPGNWEKYVLEPTEGVKCCLIDLLGTSPVLRSAMASNAETERSIELELSHVGQSSATVTVTVLPLSRLVIRTWSPQSGDALPEVP